MSLHVPGHTIDDELAGLLNYGTDDLRQQALDRAGICWLKPGEMAPACGCPWTPEKPEGPRLQLEDHFEENKRRWRDECITRSHRTGVCARGTASCVIVHRNQ
jgi:hypothetical protein